LGCAATATTLAGFHCVFRRLRTEERRLPLSERLGSGEGAAEKLPVMVWIHGGGFRVGSGTERLHHGERLAAKGVVLVTFNYRLGVFGFLAHPELTKESGHEASGNYGLRDQVAALQWVKRNIAAFGGDPDRVMIFGESVRSGSVSYMQAPPLAKGLFHAAVGESGGSFSGRNVAKLKDAEANGEKFAKAVGAASLQELRAKPTDELIAVSVGAASPGSGAYPFTPIVDSYVIAGSNSDEGTTLRIPPPVFADPVEQQQLKAVYPPGTEVNTVSGGMLWTARMWASLETKTGGTKVSAMALPSPRGSLLRAM